MALVGFAPRGWLAGVLSVLVFGIAYTVHDTNPLGLIALQRMKAARGQVAAA
jgi:hypothetical protein